MSMLSPTLVDFPSGAVAGAAVVVATRTVDGGTAIITDRTSFHPVDHGWPDQGPDTGTLTIAGVEHPVVDCVLGATDGSELFVGTEIPVRRGAAGWAFLVVHVVAGDVPVVVGAAVDLAVDAAHRHALSVGHTACHVASLALNAALAERWSKPVRTDGLGRPDFDSQANATSTIVEGGAVDTYRLGKSLRKKGFDVTGLAEALPDLQARIDETLAGWVAAGGAVAIEAVGPALTDLREWVCTTPDGQVRIPCGGTHLRNLTELGSVQVQLELAPELLTMTATAQPQG